MNFVDYKEVGRRIASRRRELGLKQWQVEQNANLCFKYLSNIERGMTVISIDVLMRLCSVLKTTPDTLLVDAQAADEDNDFLKSMSVRLNKMSSKQARLTLSLMDWILDQKLE